MGCMVKCETDNNHTVIDSCHEYFHRLDLAREI